MQFFVGVLLLVLLVPLEAFAGRPIPVHHTESGYVGSTYWATVPYTRGYEATVERDLTLRAIAIYADFDPSETCEARVYDSVGTLRTAGAAQAGIGGGTGASVGWWELPVESELFAGETVTLAVYCTSSSTTGYYEHRDPPTSQLDAPGYLTAITSRSFFGDGYPNGTNSWWGDWRLVVEEHGLHAEYRVTSYSTGTLSAGTQRGASFTTTRDHLITGVDLYVDLEVGETCNAQLFDSGGTLLETSTNAAGDGSGFRWYRTDMGAALDAGSSYTLSMYCPQATPIYYNWNDPGVYTLLDDAINVRGRSGGSNGVRPTTSNAITPVMQFREGEVEVVDRDGATDVPSSSSWSSWTWGWRFTPEIDMTLHGIEAFNRRSSGTARARVYETATGTLIGSSATSMPASDQEEWRFAPLPDVPLYAGTEYTAAVYYAGASTTAKYYSGTASSTYSRPGVLSNVDFCSTVGSIDTMPTTCTYNHRVERLIVSVPEPSGAMLLTTGAGVLFALVRRRGAHGQRHA